MALAFFPFSYKVIHFINVSLLQRFAENSYLESVLERAEGISPCNRLGRSFCTSLCYHEQLLHAARDTFGLIRSSTSKIWINASLIVKARISHRFQENKSFLHRKSHGLLSGELKVKALYKHNGKERPLLKCTAKISVLIKHFQKHTFSKPES